MEHPEIFKKWFGKVIPTGDNKFSALNSCILWRILHLCSAWRESQPSASSLFSYQRRKLRPIQAHADHS